MVVFSSGMPQKASRVFEGIPRGCCRWISSGGSGRIRQRDSGRVGGVGQGNAGRVNVGVGLGDGPAIVAGANGAELERCVGAVSRGGDDFLSLFMNGIIKVYRYRLHRGRMVWTRDFSLTLCGSYAGNVLDQILVYSECALY